MRKVVQMQIDHQFMPVDPSFLEIGTTIDFNCYIKRYNGYVIIIEAGSAIDPSLYDHVCKHDRIFIKSNHLQNFETYRKDHPKVPAKAEAGTDTTGMAALPIEKLSAGITAEQDVKEKIRLLYESGIGLIDECFNAPEDNLPIRNVFRYAKILSEFITVQRYRLEQILEQMPDRYRESCHALDVAILATILAGVVDLSQRQIEDIAVAGLLHDIGKRNIAAAILNKESRLEDDEFEAVREHSLFSVQIARQNQVNNPQILSAIRYHHERMDGSGYPNGLVGNQIPVMAQILGVCDVFDALTTDRTFRSRYSSFEALKLMKLELGKEINTVYVDHLIRLLKK